MFVGINFEMKNFNLLIYVLGSLIYLALPIVFSPEFGEGGSWSQGPFRVHLIQAFLFLGFFFVNHFYAVPKLLFDKKKIQFAGVALLFLLFTVILPVALQEFFRPNPNEFLPPKPHPGHHRPTPLMLIDRSLIQYSVVLVVSILLGLQKRYTALKQEKLASEISYLKAQINPHFLFNALNNIYALSLSKSEETPESIMRLSRMMRYVVSESENEWVPLEKELQYIQDYVAFQELRISGNCDLHFSIQGDTQQHKISPLVLIPFVENAFKYGLNPDKQSLIHIDIQITPKHVEAKIQNSTVVQDFLPEEKSEVGMQNTRKRLDYVYGGSYTLEIEKKDDIYRVFVSIPLQ